MTSVNVKVRDIGATATIERLGHPSVTSNTGGHFDIVTGAAVPGFNPLDLMFASLASCIAISCRIAASRLGLLDRLVEARAAVTGEKSIEEPYRLTLFTIDLSITGEFVDEEKAAIADMAEHICTVSNTLKGSADIVINLR